MNKEHSGNTAYLFSGEQIEFYNWGNVYKGTILKSVLDGNVYLVQGEDKKMICVCRTRLKKTN